MRSRPGLLLTVCLAVVLINLNTTIVNIALPTLADDLSANTRDLLWIVDGYNLTFAALVLAAGSLSDKFGRRPALLLGLGVFAAASAASALVDSSGALIATRFAAGIGAAVIFPTTLSVIANAYSDRRERATALGLWGAAVGIGVATGPVVGGFLLEHFAWQSIFWALVPMALAGIALTLWFVPESRDPDVPGLDVPGLVISVAMLGLLTWTIIEAPDAGWLSTRTLVGFGMTLALLTAFVRRETTTEDPMLDIALFRDARFSAAAMAVTISYFTMFGFIFMITQFFQFLRDYGALSTGTRIIPVAISIAVTSIIGGYLAPRIGAKLVVSTGLASLTIAFGWISTMDLDAAYSSVIVPQMLLLGAGIGLVSTPATESIMQVLPPARAGIGSAVNDATRELGGTLGVAVVGSIFSSVYGSRMAEMLRDALPSRQLAVVEESVGAADAVGATMTPVRLALESSFMDGLGTACIVLAAICAVGAAATLAFLPGAGEGHESSRPTSSDPTSERSVPGGAPAS